ncbi:MAG: PH domain-containing protein, partial [Micromonosporaceae bacterium]
LARRALAYEWGMWRSLYLWTFRRPLTRDPDARTFGYASTLTPIFVGFIVVSAIEIPLLHLMLPWRTVQMIALALRGYGPFWMIGLLASLRVHPQVVSRAGLRARYGPTIDFTIPWDAVSTVRTRRRDLDRQRTVQLEHTGSGLILNLAISKQNEVDVVLRQPRTVRLPRGGTEPISQLRICADDPKALVAQSQRHLSGELAREADR